MRSGCEELQDEPERLADKDEDKEERSSATLWREPESDWREGGGHERRQTGRPRPSAAGRHAHLKFESEGGGMGSRKVLHVGAAGAGRRHADPIGVSLGERALAGRPQPEENRFPT